MIFTVFFTQLHLQYISLCFLEIKLGIRGNMRETSQPESSTASVLA